MNDYEHKNTKLLYIYKKKDLYSHHQQNNNLITISTNLISFSINQFRLNSDPLTIPLFLYQLENTSKEYRHSVAYISI